LWHMTYIWPGMSILVHIAVDPYTYCRTKHWPLSHTDKWKERTKHYI
jgi:hypothetical protein